MKRDIFIIENGKRFELTQRGTSGQPLCCYCDKPIPKRAREDRILTANGEKPALFHSNECAVRWAVYIAPRLVKPAGEGA